MRGYFTLEATLLFPMIIVVYLGVFYMGFYQYDRCMAEQNLRSAILRGSRSMEETSGADISSLYEKLVEDCFAAATAESVQVDISQGEIQGKAKGALDIPAIFFWKAGQDETWSFIVSTESREWEPAFWLRLHKRLKKEDETWKE